MSRKPSQQCGPPSFDQRYLNPIRSSPYNTEYQGAGSISNYPPPPQEPPRFLYPDSYGYDPTVTTRPYGTWLPSQGNSSAEPRYNSAPGNAGSLLQHSLQRRSPMGIQQRAPGSMEYSGSPYHDASNSTFGYERGSVGSGRWSNDVDSQYSSSSVTLASPVHSDRSMTAYPGSNAVMTKCQHQEQQQQQQQKRPSDCSSAMGLNRILQHSPMPPPPRKPASTSSRYHLYIRQQPIAARACGAGDRDRRPVDPPPIIQMLMTDFDSMWDLHLDILQDPRFTVGCFLFPVMPAAWSSSSESTSWENRAEENAPGFSTPLLSGKAFVSPFYVDADPDPNTAPEHPSSGWPPNPNLNLPRLRPPTPEDKKRPPRIPSTFFIFSDLSVRTAGLYRLQFRLMNWGHVEDTGQSMPILAEAWSDPFRVYPAKDFPGMRDSSRLAEGLKELGFVELKTRGKGKGKGRKR